MADSDNTGGYLNIRRIYGSWWGGDSDDGDGGDGDGNDDGDSNSDGGDGGNGDDGGDDDGDSDGYDDNIVYLYFIYIGGILDDINTVIFRGSQSSASCHWSPVLPPQVNDTWLKTKFLTTNQVFINDITKFIAVRIN